MMYCRPYLYVRCTWPDLSCAHARMHITHARLRCAGQALMIEGREKGRKGSDSGIFRPTNLRCLFSGLYNWIQNGGYPFYLAVGRHFNFSLWSSVFGILFITCFNACLFLRNLQALFNCLCKLDPHQCLLYSVSLIRTSCSFKAVVSLFPVSK